jgi:hypothetical protein
MGDVFMKNYFTACQLNASYPRWFVMAALLLPLWDLSQATICVQIGNYPAALGHSARHHLNPQLHSKRRKS